MRTIICPTDFSDTAKNASVYAAKLAEDIGAELRLVHIMHVPIIDVNSPIDVLDSLMDAQREATKTKLETERERLSTISAAHVKIQSDFGLAVDGISEMAESVEAFLTVMGTNGETGVIDKILGTVSNGVVKRNKIATLVIPLNVEYQGLTKVVFANDHKEDIDKQLEFIFSLNAKRKPKIDVVSVAANKEEPHYLEEVIADEGGVKQVCVWSDDIKHGLNQYMENNLGQILAVKHHHRSFFEELFHRSTTTGLLSNASVPTLVFN